MSDSSDAASDVEYEVEKIIDHKGNGRARKYYVKWMNYDDSNNTWEPTGNLETVPELVEQYLASLETSESQTRRTKAASKKQSPRPKTAKAQAEKDEAPVFISESESDDDAPLFEAPPTKRILRKSKKNVNSDSESDWGHAKTKRLRTTKRNKKDIDTDTDSSGDASDSGSDIENTSTKAEEVDRWERRHLEMTIDGKYKSLDAIVDFEYPSGDINWELEIKKVVGIYCDTKTNDKRAILLWKNGDYSLQQTKKMIKKCPSLLLKYYENHMTFKDDIKVTKK